MDPGTQSGWCQSGSRQPRGTAGRSSQGSIFELQTRARKKKKIILTKNANLTFVDEGFGLRCVGNAFLCLECPSDAGKR